jgi:hypothetical protein
MRHGIRNTLRHRVFMRLFDYVWRLQPVLPVRL